MPFQIFSGIYDTFEETRANDRPFESAGWFDNVREKVRQAYERGMVDEQYVLPLLAALAGQNERITILDFGGGVSAIYPQVLDALPTGTQLDFHVVDTAASCREGRDCHRGDNRIQFHEQLPDNLQDIQIVHLGSVLQYIDDWQGLLRTLAKLQADYMLISDAMVGPFASFVTVQDYYGQKIPFRFTNLDELVQFFDGQLDYRLCYKSKYLPSIQGTKGFYKMDNFSQPYRLELSSHLLFKRK
ncbi:MAG: methyltransferase, TIGR04325 family [Magnetococcales bacterium]|nr:methyltransferase, TIGR04325 family [Magnetococcales bacterium]